MFRNFFQKGTNFNFQFHTKRNFGIRDTIKEKTGLSLSLKTAKSNKYLGYGLFGVSVAGLSYLAYNNYNTQSKNQQGILNSFMKAPSNIVNERMRSTLLYFSGGLASTACLTALVMKNPRLLGFGLSGYSVFLTLPAFLVCTYQVRAIPNNSQENNIKKHLFWIAMNGLFALSLAPLVSISEAKMVADAFLLTTGCFGGLAFVAYNSHDTSFLGMSGFLGAGLGALMAISIANIFFQSHALFNIWLYGGLALFMGLSLYDLKNLQIRAQRLPYFDPLGESLGIYMNFINIFVRILIMNNNRRK